MAYRVEMECTQTFVDPTTGEAGVHSGERRPVGHPDVDGTWRAVVVEVPDEPAPAPAPQPAATPPAAAEKTSTNPTRTGVKQ